MFIPETPAGTVLFDLESNTEQGAWDNLMRAAPHMPYKGKKGFIDRGYSVCEYEDEPCEDDGGFIS